jgi:hypothetical protein
LSVLSEAGNFLKEDLAAVLACGELSLSEMKEDTVLRLLALNAAFPEPMFYTTAHGTLRMYRYSIVEILDNLGGLKELVHEARELEAKTVGLSYYESVSYADPFGGLDGAGVHDSFYLQLLCTSKNLFPAYLVGKKQEETHPDLLLAFSAVGVFGKLGVKNMPLESLVQGFNENPLNLSRFKPLSQKQKEEGFRVHNSNTGILTNAELLFLLGLM